MSSGQVQSAPVHRVRIQEVFVRVATARSGEPRSYDIHDLGLFVHNDVMRNSIREQVRR